MEWIISIVWDEEASVWIATNEKLGLAMESNSFDLLIERVKNAVPELIELNHLSKDIKLLFKAERHQTVTV